MKADMAEDMTEDIKTVDLYTDGACKGNPGVGGWGVLMRYGGHERTLCGGAGETTNNRMELLAVIEGLKALNRPCRVRVHTDSQYVQKGISEWLPNWLRRGWKTAGGGAVKNQDLWQALQREAGRHEVEWHWVKGHAGHVENERADALANEGVRRIMAGES
jgi:ribonuclease HI